MTAPLMWSWAWDYRNFALAAALPEGAGFAHVYPDGHWRIATARGFREADPCRRPRICMASAQAEVEKTLGELLGGAA